ncbi:MAG TPA: sensor domain-containing diguanylate cyclase [Candidatus Dormibacteraeota bacterium]|jgi:diguanylate cyclase (GGDEF)-like protein|nr:sensor domain-containing diguanylate cyclase [Candidatus Dormibacteraeota bacterium]
MVGPRSAAPRRAAGFAVVLMFAALLVRLLTLPLPAARWDAELALGVGGGLYGALTVGLLGREWMWREAAVVLRALLGALIAGLIVSLAAGYLERIDVVAVLLFATVVLSAPAQARARALAAATLLSDGALAAVWLVWLHGDVATLLLALAFLTGLQIVVVAQAKAVGAIAESDELRRTAHGLAAERVGTAIDVLGVTRAVLETSRDSYPLTTQAALLLYEVVADRLRPLPLYLAPAGVSSLDADNLDVTLAPGEGLAGRVFSASRPLVWPTAYDVGLAQESLSEQVREQLLGLRRGVILSAIGAPLIIDDEVIGVYVLTSSRQELVWGEEDVSVVSALADEAARAIERARRYERELDQAHLDSITGLANHRQLTRTLDQEVARARRRNTSLGVVFCDLDRFKAVNDTFGHSAGDRVLTILAQVFHDSLRREDSAARYGGDEFVCVLPGADQQEAATVGLRISTSFEIRVRDDPELCGAGVTISCGVAMFPDNADSVDGLLQHADAAMRRVKAGRRAGLAEGLATR